MAANIYALSTASGKAGLAVIRISGPNAISVIQKMTSKSIEPRQVSLRNIRHPKTGDILDNGLVIYFQAPHSFTGEDCVELQVHGGQAVVQLTLEALGTLNDFELAEPGEFTRRAFHNQKLDLVEIEGLADLLEAETEAQQKQALRQMQGELSSVYQNWRTQLIKAMALFEAGIDFVDEEDVPKSLIEPVRQELKDLNSAISAHLNDNRKGERLRSGLKLVIIGKPNVGKSSLMNHLTQRNAAIVSDKAGTTRDIIETHLNIGGYPIILTDTAGIRETDEEVEKTGVERALEEAKIADIVLRIIDVTDTDHPIVTDTPKQDIDSATIRIANKADLLKEGDHFGSKDIDCLISVKTGKGLKTLLDIITDKASELSGNQEQPYITRNRHRQALIKTNTYIELALNKLGSKDEELIAEDLRQAAHSLGSITGHVDVEDLLDVIFAQFCIGK